MKADGELTMIPPTAWTRKTGASGRHRVKSRFSAVMKNTQARSGKSYRSRFQVAKMHEKAKILV